MKKVIVAAVAGAALAVPMSAQASTPRLGLSVNLPCANPANHGLVGRVLGAVNGLVGAQMRCYARAVAHPAASGPQLMAGPTGLSPTQIQSAYKLAGLNASGRTVAVVDAYDDPLAESDLATFRSAYHLPACTTANGCFRKINQNGGSTPPAGDYGWAEEESLDLDAISSACPSCHILLVEANSAGTADLDKAEDTAAAQPGVAAISNSWGGTEDATELSDDAHFNHPGLAITASAGDSGYGTSWPATSPYVTAVGGTSLAAASNPRGWTETVWSGTGSGCSPYEPKPAWQTDTGCAKNRTDNDVAADGDPSSGIGIYDTYNACGSNGLCDLLIELGIVPGLDGWAQAGGTSLSSPLVASVYALAGNTGSLTYGSYPYGHSSALFDVASGSNGVCGSYLCQAQAGYDGPSGNGTPDGTGGF